MPEVGLPIRRQASLGIVDVIRAHASSFPQAELRELAPLVPVASIVRRLSGERQVLLMKTGTLLPGHAPSLHAARPHAIVRSVKDTPEIDRPMRAHEAAGAHGVAPLVGACSLTVAAGGLHALSMPPSTLGWAVPGVVGMAFCSVQRARSGGHAFALGYLYGLVVHLGVFHWLFEIPETPAAILGVGYLALAAILALAMVMALAAAMA